MVPLVVDLVDVFTQPRCEPLQGPDCQMLGINFWCHQAGILARFRVSEQVVNQHLLCRSKESLDHRPCAWLRWRTIFFCDKVPGEQGLKVDTTELWAAIDKAFLW